MTSVATLQDLESKTAHVSLEIKNRLTEKKKHNLDIVIHGNDFQKKESLVYAPYLDLKVNKVEPPIMFITRFDPTKNGELETGIFIEKYITSVTYAILGEIDKDKYGGCKQVSIFMEVELCYGAILFVTKIFSFEEIQHE